MTGISSPWRAWMAASSGQRAGSVFWPTAICVCLKRRIWLLYPAGEGWMNPYPKRSAAPRGMPAAASYSICSGVFVLAASGLLDGRKATTHWRYTQALKTRFPAITVVEDVLYRDEGDILTSAGSAAGLICVARGAPELRYGGSKPRGASTGDPAPSGRLANPAT